MNTHSLLQKRVSIPVYAIFILVLLFLPTGAVVYNQFLQVEIHRRGEVHVVVVKSGVVTADFWIHNLLTNTGKDLVKTDLGVGGSVTAALYIALANATFTAGASSTQCCGGTDKSYPASGGLNPQTGAYTSTGTGTWTVVKQFTITGGVPTTVYGAGLLQAATSGEIAEATFSGSQTLSNVGDSITITWSQTVS